MIDAPYREELPRCKWCGGVLVKHAYTTFLARVLEYVWEHRANGKEVCPAQDSRVGTIRVAEPWGETMTREEYRVTFWRRAYENGIGLVSDPVRDADEQTNSHMKWADDLPVPPWSMEGSVNMMDYVERNPR